VFEQADVAGHERGRKEAEDLPEREVPWHDGEDDADGVPADVGGRVFAIDGAGFEEGSGVGGEVAAGGGALLDFEAGGGKGLAHLGGDGGGELFAVVVE